MKILLKRFHLNGNIVGFHSQTRRWETPYKTSLVILVEWVHSHEFLVTKAVNQKFWFNKMIPDVLYFIFLVKETDSYAQTWPTIRLERWTFDLKSFWCVSFFVSTWFTLQTVKGHSQMNLTWCTGIGWLIICHCFTEMILEPLILFDNFLSTTVLVTAKFNPGHLWKFWWYTHQVFAACPTDETKLWLSPSAKQRQNSCSV